MNQKVAFAFLLVAVSAVLAHPGIARDDAQAPPAAAVVEPVSPSSPAPPAVPEEQPTSAALLDDATAEPVTLPAAQEGSLPAAEQSSNDNIAIPNAAAIAAAI